MWTLTADGQTDERVLAERDRGMRVSHTVIREQRTKELDLEVPQVPFPRSIDDVGRQWTATGPDTPRNKP